jgi:rubredoxin
MLVSPKAKDAVKMQKYECGICGYVYDPAKGDPVGGVEPGTPFDQLLSSWECPVCGASKDNFKPVVE